MYQYDQLDQAFVDQRVSEFRDQTRRFLAGELSEDEFKLLRLRNGLYIQRHAPMLRIAIPYGLLASRQLRKLGEIARRYDRSFGHFTTRQNLQLNWPKLEDVPDILEQLATVQMHAIQTSGNCIRNVTADHMAGIAEDEVDDPRPYCEIIRQWANLHPEFTYLPRKFKIAVTGSPADRAASEVHDIGLHLRRDKQGNIGFQVLVGGGLGRTPIIGQVIREFLPLPDLLSYLDAILRVYNRYGRRDNIHKARIKILVKSLGIARFRDQVETEWQAARDIAPGLEASQVERVRSFFQPPAYESLQNIDVAAGREPQFQAWYRYNTRPHRVAGYRAAFVSLKAHGQNPGDMSSGQMEAVAALADRVSFGLIRVTHSQNLLLGDVRQSDLYAVWQELRGLGLAMPNIGTLTDMIACPGLDFCSLANAGTLNVAKQIQEQFDDLDYLYDLGDIEIKMSGCMNACGHHHVGHIGILGVDKHGEEWYQITLGGSVNGFTALGEVIGPSVPQAEVASTIERIVEVYRAEREDGERFIETIRRIGVKPFKEGAYATHSQAA
ncbi:MAG: nitrite/sulfite reductase [Gammaproteobacteria bacterium]|jgi:sulfite reductase (NADPH) hemoprotein beta-component|nr:nitrite/sulfite reductase [Gammaproteobacteria bacterium]HEV7441495.1 nitrite/sulfite reductase [Steroidobacteraceae bacterium]